MRRLMFVSAWLLATGGASVFLYRSLAGARRTLFLPGRTTSGHHQIEDKCELCHDLGGAGVRQEACVRCHGDELADASDSHPLAMFLDPRNATDLAAIDVRRCTSCHVEHRPSITGPMGVSRPAAFCVACHADVAAERPSHRALPFDGCADAGCHNYHDNRALGEAFLADHLDEPELTAHPVVPALDRDSRYGGLGSRPLTRRQQDAPPGVTPSETVLAEWQSTEHAAAGVNCTDCHGGAPTMERPWTDRPGLEGCRECHGGEVAGFLRGKHGMRLASGLPAMRPELARLPMRASARGREIGCATCHAAHAFDRRRAAVEACLECHDDRHSLAYLDSPHHGSWKLEQARNEGEGGGVSCATCHMPRVRVVDTDRPGVTVEHDQNAALRPIETMVRPVCQPCHGVAYSLAAMAEPGLAAGNFRRAPALPARAIQMVRDKVKRGPPAAKEDRR
ncbi:MAG TPA: cytochrome c3 family protein [Kofleriaceae bacterium]|nr:cytochrome c3 family protein [Kofleriaceae bacterium]